MELEQYKPDTAIKQKMGGKEGGKKQKKGLIARDQISASVAAIICDNDESPCPHVEVAKCKSGTGLEAMPRWELNYIFLAFFIHYCLHCRPDPKCMKSTHSPCGLISGWEKVMSVQPAATKQKQMFLSTKNAWSAASSRANSEPNDISVFGYGGIPSDEENIEHQELDNAGSEKQHMKYKVCSTL